MSIEGWRRKFWMAVVLGALLASWSSARAQNVEDMRHQLEQMQQQMQELNQKIERMEAEQAKAKAEAKESGYKLNPHRLEIESNDGQFSMRLRGRVQIDGAVYNNDKTRLGDGAEIRRAYLGVQGKLYGDWKYISRFNFAPGDSVSPNDIYLRYTGLDQGDVTVGYFKEPFSLEELTSDNNITFMERSLADMFTPVRNLGLGFNSHGPVSRGGWSAAAGFFGQGFDSNQNGEVNSGYGITGRATLAPIAQKTRVLHLGAAVSYRATDSNDNLRFRTRPESHVTNVRLVDTGTFDNVNSFMRYGLEAAGVYGPFSLQSEYMWVNVDSSPNNDPDFSGYYVYGSYFLTGESRPYNAARGTFGGVKPNRNFSRGGGPGAWELGVRFSDSDLTSGNVDGGKQQDLTVGVNWYVNPNIRFMANYVNVLNVDGGPYNNDEPSVYQLRAQVAF
jgi:phosphate-selective porin OprO/OprP